MPRKKKDPEAYVDFIFRNRENGKETSVPQGSVHAERLSGMSDRMELVGAVQVSGKTVRFEEAPVDEAPPEEE